MTLGQRIRAARLEAGLSQRELAGEELTRNMLSSLEHDTANPSLATLQLLSRRLGKPIGWLLGEDGASEAAAAFGSGDYRRCLELLKDGPERQWLEPVAQLREAELAVDQGRLPYARGLLEQLDGGESPIFGPELRRKAAILRCRCGIFTEIPEDDALLEQAAQALTDGRLGDALRYLSARDARDDRWHYLMGEVAFAGKDYPAAREHYHQCEAAIEVRSRLEICCREMEDYKMAYYYARLEK